MATLRFLGATGTVTGSKFLVEAAGKRILIDAGLYQGAKELRLRNWSPPPFDPSTLDVIALTHAHIDHSGYLPALVRHGYRGRVLTTRATADLLGLLLPDSGRLQEEEAATANKLRYSKHSPARPLYSEEDARHCLPLLDGFDYRVPVPLAPGLTLTFHPAGHILGSATITLEVEEPGRPRRQIVFSGDLGRRDAPVLPDPVPLRGADTLLLECTYGDREHPAQSPRDALAEAINEAAARRGAILIPSFAIGRAQDLLYHLRELEAANRIPVLDVFLDSPMAQDATPIYRRHLQDHDEEMRALLERGVRPFQTQRLHFTRTVAESKAINEVRTCIIISASGMATGGRVLHHLKNRLPDPRNTVLFVGFQAAGTRGRTMLDGARTVKMHGEHIRVAAQVRSVSGFSAHADWRETMRWLDGFETAPAQVFCVHGEPRALAAMQEKLRARGLSARTPAYQEAVEV